jgi:hypothetical protein
MHQDLVKVSSTSSLQDCNSWDLSLRCDPWLATEAAITEKEECLGKVVPSKFNPHIGNCIKIQLTTLQFPCTIRLTMKNAKTEIVTQSLRQKNPVMDALGSTSTSTLMFEVQPRCSESLLAAKSRSPSL